MEEIATLAAVSKQTVYKHFTDKERLFSEIVTRTVNQAADTVNAMFKTSPKPLTSTPLCANSRAVNSVW